MFVSAWVGLALAGGGGTPSVPPPVSGPPVTQPAPVSADLSAPLLRDRRLFRTGLGLSIGFGAASAGLGAWGTLSAVQFYDSSSPQFAGASAAMVGANVGGILMGVAAQRSNNLLRREGVVRGTPRGALAVGFGAAGAGASAVASAMFASDDPDLVGWGVVWGLHGLGFAATSIGLAARDMSRSGAAIEQHRLAPAVSLVPSFDPVRQTVGVAGVF